MKPAAVPAARLSAPLSAVLRELALAHLDAAVRARVRLKDPEDTEALHDFRVALRRLRSLLRAYRPYAGIVPKKLRKRLRRIARATNAARDAEVQLEWLRHARLPAVARAAGHWLGARLRAHCQLAYDALPDEAIEPFDQLHAGLRKGLAQSSSSRRRAGDYRGVTSRTLTEHTESLARAVSAVRSLNDAAAIHKARIEGKRLRYLIEPLAPAIPGARALIRRMKAFQDDLGELCDLFALAHTIESVAGNQAAENAQLHVRQAWLGEPAPSANPAAPVAGLMALVRYLRDCAERRYARIEREYRGERMTGLTGPVSALVRRLQIPPRTRRRSHPRAV
jgi:CHAD domain-containing protein